MKTRTSMTWLAAALFALAAPFALIACGDSGSGGTPDARQFTDIDSGTPDARTIDAAPSADADCITDPQTAVEILNACTTATKIHKVPVLPLLNPDGTLPPLP